MARVETLVLTDDIDGGPAQQTVRFALDGVAYEIDLTDEHATQLKSDIAVFVAAARKVTGTRRPAAVPARKVSAYDPQAVRAWAGSQGVEIPARGRIPRAVVNQFHAAGY